ncbi:MAG TPA: TPM domain-containing protein, partial [Chitinophagaceae bacterium]
EYATALGRKWGIGNKEFNNGVVILISTGGGDGNRDAYIAVGYGLEGAIPDVTAKYIVEHELIPNFKEGNYYRGLDEATDAVIKAAAGEYKAPASYGKGKNKGIPFKTIIIIIIVIVILISGGGRNGTYVSRGGWTGWSGGGWSGGSGGGWSGGGGGGFGGFGGGSFGGGGAGGKW